MRISDWSSDVCSSDLTAALDDTALDDREIDAILGRIQNDLFDLGADLATPEVENPKYPPLRIVAEQVERLEGEIDRLNADQIGRASWRERVCQYVSISVVAVSFKKKTSPN